MIDHFEQEIVLRRFYEQANKLADKKFDCFSMFKVEMSFVADGKTPGKVRKEFPDEDLLKVFLMDFRFFYIKENNPYNFKKICEHFIEDGFEVEKTRKFLSAYNQLFLDESLRLRIGDKNLSTKMIFETILNEGHFHQERGQKGLNLINTSPFIEPIARIKFFSLISILRMIICSFNVQVVEKYLEMK